MQHLDEGTIHAWLDGALGQADAARVETHVAECAACAAAVAEARGLIAGASRVLGALDPMPSHVVPAGLSAPPTARSKVADIAGVRRAGRRLFRLTPARLAAAAVIVVAAGTMLTMTGRERRPYATSVTQSRDAAAPRPAPGPSVPAPSVPAQSMDSVAVSSGKNATEALQKVVLSPPSAHAPVAMATPKTRAADRVADASSGAVRRAAPAGVAGGVAAAEMRDTTRGFVAGQLRSQTEVAAAPAAPTVAPSPAPSAARNAAPSAASVGRPARAAMEQVATTSVRADSGRVEQRKAAAGGAAADAATRQRAAAAPSAFSYDVTVARCFEVSGATNTVRLPARFVLDTASVGSASVAGTRAVTTPDLSGTLPRGSWRVVSQLVEITWNDSAWAPLTIDVASAIDARDNVTVQVDGRAVTLRRCPAR